MKIYRTRYFAKWQSKEKLLDALLLKAIEELANGLHDGNLGAHLYKKRIAQPARGKRESYRTIIACKLFDKAFFIYGYSKSNRANISLKELEAYKEASALFLEMKETQLKSLVLSGQLIEVDHA
jgi:hypothetical protein